MTTPDAARRRIERLRATNAAAADLATLLSTAVRIEPALVRRMRLLLPRADVGAELDLWGSDVVASASPLAMSLEPACAEALRGDLAGTAYAELRERAADVVEEVHAGLHWSLRLEERINRLMVRGDARSAQEAEGLLFAAIAELRATAAAGPTAAVEATGLARWLLAALGRIPRALAGTEAAVVAGLGAGTQLDGRFDPASDASSATEAWMPWLLSAAAVEPRTVSARFSDGSLTLNEPGPGEVTLVVPGTDPMVLDVTWHDGTAARHERLRFRPGEPAGLHAGADEVILQALTGERWRLARPRQSEALLTGLDFSAVRARLRPCLGRRREADELVQLVYSKQRVVAVTGEPRIGKSALAGAALDTLDRIGYLVAEHVYGVREGWDEPAIVAASLEAKLRAALGPALDAAREAPPDPAPPQSATGRRRALLVVNTRFADDALADLVDVELPALTDVLQEAQSRGFEVDRLVDAPSRAILGAVERLVHEAEREDELLLYVASHGLVDGSGLYLAASDTRAGTVETAVPEDRLLTLASRTAASSTVLILDCCSDVSEDTAGVLGSADRERRIPPKPRIALLRGSAPVDDVRARGFTVAGALVEGLRSGSADLDGDGAITVAELAGYVRQQGREVETAGDTGIVIAQVAPHADESARALDSSLLAAAGRAAQDRRLQGVVLALDDVPASVVDRLPIAGPIPPGVALLLTTRAPAPALEQAFAGDRPTVATLNSLGSQGVCREIVAWRGEELALAFGEPPDPDELIGLVDTVPGRLAALVEWILDQPVGRARLSEAPPTLTGRPDEIWDGLDEAHLQALGAIAAARPGFTPDDLERVIARTAGGSDAGRAADLVEDLVRRRFVRVDGPVEDPSAPVQVTHGSVAGAYMETYDAGLRLAHGAHALAFPHGDPSSATPYQLANAAHHHVQARLTTSATLLARSGGYLDLRRRAAGLDAVDADLAALTPFASPAAQLRAAIALCRAPLEAEPERFAELVDNALRALGQVDLAETTFHMWHRSSLRVRALHEVAETASLWRYDGPVAAAVQGPSGDVVSLGAGGVRVHRGSGADPPVPVAAPDGSALLALAGETVVVAGGRTVTVLRPGRDPEDVDTGGAGVRSLLADGASIVAGLDDGRLLHLRLGADKVRRRTLLGHAAAVTALAWLPTGLASASDDGTVRVWDTDSGVARLVYRGHSAPVVALVSLDTGGVVTGDADGRLRLWDPVTGRDLGVLAGNDAPVTAIRALQGGAVCVTADGAIRWWQLSRAGRPLDRRLSAPGPPLLRVGVAGRAVVGWGADSVLRWWDAETGDVRQQVRLTGVAPPVHDLLVGNAEVVVVHPGGLVACPHPGQAPATVSASLRGMPADAYLDALFLALNEVQALVGTATGMAMVDLRSGALKSFAGQPVVSVGTWRSEIISVNADGGITQSSENAIGLVESRGAYLRVVAEGGSNGSAWLQSADGGLVDYRGEHNQSGRHIALAPGDTAFAAVRAERQLLAVGDRMGSVRVLEPYSASNQADVVRLEAAAVTALAFMSERRLVSGDADGMVRRIDLDGTSTPVVLGRHRGPVTGLARLAGGDQVISIGADGTLRQWDLETGLPLAVVGGPVGFRAVSAAAGVVAARDQEGRLWVLDADDVPHVTDLRSRVLLSGSSRNGSTGQEYDASFTVRLRAREPVELRGVQAVNDPPVRGRDAQVAVTLDDVPVAVDAVGRLAVPRRLPEGADVQLAYMLQVTAPRLRGEWHPDLRLTLWSPERGEGDLSWSSSTEDALREEAPA